MNTTTPKKIFFSAALFNSKECIFNIELLDRLEKLGYTHFLAQRDDLFDSLEPRLFELLMKGLKEQL